MSLKVYVMYVRCSLETDDKSFLPERIRRLTSKSKSTVLVLSSKTSKKVLSIFASQILLGIPGSFETLPFPPLRLSFRLQCRFLFCPDIIKFRGTFHPSKCFAEAVAPK